MMTSASSSMTTCNTSLPITDEIERAVDEAKQQSDNTQNYVTTQTCSPINDFLQKTSARGLPPTPPATASITQSPPLTLSTKATTALSTPPPSPPSPVKGEAPPEVTTAIPLSSTSKIPYPFLHPVKQQQQHQQRNINPSSSSNNNKSTSSINQFQRSASLRLRGKNSNFLFNNINVYNNMEHGKNINTRIEQNTTTTTAMRATSAKKFNFGTHNEYPATGQISARRKLELNSPPLPADIGLTRSLSLRRNYRSHFKTDSLAKQASSSTSSSCIAGQTAAITGIQKDLHANDIDGNAEREREAPDGGNCCGITIAGKENPTNIMTELEAAKRESNKDVQKNMSLKLNGSAAATTTTTTTASGNGTTTTSTVTTPKTPKTPISHSKHNYHQHHHYCTSKSSPLSAVPETKLTPKTPPVTPDSPCTYLDDDLDSLYSFATTTSGRSTMSCEHPYVARNGTTFSGRKMKYVVHCSNYAGQVGPDYLTPTQRAQRHIRRLRELLNVARQDLEHKDTEILRLTREVVELRLFKASLSSPEERSASSDAVTVREADLKTSQDVSPIVDMVDDATKSSPRHIVNAAAGHHHQNDNHHHHHHHHHSQPLSSDMQSSFADSGHFEDLTTSSIHSKDSYAGHTHDIACGSDEAAGTSGSSGCGAGVNVENYELQRQELIRIYEQKIEELIRSQDAGTSEMKRSHNDKVEALLQKLAECNTRYADIVPDYEHAKERIRELEKQLEDLQRKLIEHEEKQNKMYLHMYQQGQEAERIARADQALELAHRAPNNKVSINELLHQLQNTQDELENIRAAECRSNECGSNHALLTAKEAISLWVLGARKTIYRRLMDAQKTRTHVDPEVTLQFLKSAIYYFLTDKENSQGHLQAIESILEFTEAEKSTISKAGLPK